MFKKILRFAFLRFAQDDRLKTDEAILSHAETVDFFPIHTPSIKDFAKTFKIPSTTEPSEEFRKCFNTTMLIAEGISISALLGESYPCHPPRKAREAQKTPEAFMGGPEHINTLSRITLEIYNDKYDPSSASIPGLFADRVTNMNGLVEKEDFIYFFDAYKILAKNLKELPSQDQACVHLKALSIALNNPEFINSNNTYLQLTLENAWRNDQKSEAHDLDDFR